MKVLKFNSLNLAKSYAANHKNPRMIILGDDDKYWIVNHKVCTELLAAGFQRA